ncbi:MAG TPA: long-chain fatty acid--CoA ligase, partial [Spirochaetes bacterium]|nr:long-chain fatty acid--CoA ligase [Spirochaetota bacterium]
ITGDIPGSNLVMTLEELIELGSNKHEKELVKRISDLQPSDIATFVYTSGTTGVPKGTVLTHESFLAGVYGSTKSLPSLEGLETINFLPLCHVLGRENSFIHMYSGTVQWYAESFEKLGENIREAKPHFFSAVPRVFEKAFNKISDKVENKGPRAVRLFNWSIQVGREVSQHLQNKERIPFNLKWKYLIAKRLVFNKIHKGFGGRLEFVVSGGAPLSRKLSELFHAVGILILEGYGLTETCSATHVNQRDNFRFGTVGLPIDGIEAKLADDNEILVRGKSIMLGYYKNEKLTKEALSPEGWYHTEDIGEIDSEGFLKIVDRKKDLIVTSGGKNVAPQYIENLLKSSPYISECLVYGDKRNFLSALIVPDEERTRAWARKNNIAHKTFTALIRKKEIIQFIEKEIEDIGQDIASYQRVKKFALLDKEFTEAAGEITPSLKLKRSVIIKKHQKLLDQFYENRYN